MKSTSHGGGCHEWTSNAHRELGVALWLVAGRYYPPASWGGGMLWNVERIRINKLDADTVRRDLATTRRHLSRADRETVVSVADASGSLAGSA